MHIQVTRTGNLWLESLLRFMFYLGFQMYSLVAFQMDTPSLFTCGYKDISPLDPRTVSGKVSVYVWKRACCVFFKNKKEHVSWHVSNWTEVISQFWWMGGPLLSGFIKQQKLYWTTIQSHIWVCLYDVLEMDGCDCKEVAQILTVGTEQFNIWMWCGSTNLHMWCLSYK